MTRQLTRGIGAIMGSAALLAVGACADLEITNPNNPDIERALASPEDVINIANSTIFNWYRSATYIYPFTTLSVAGDVHTSNFGNFGMRFSNVEPRIAYDNNSAGADADVARLPWANAYADLGLGNDVMIALNAGVSLGSPADDAKYAALAQFTQAASLTSLAWNFDKAFVVDENTDLSQPAQAVPYQEVAAAAEARWDALISALGSQDNTYDTDVLPLASGDGEYSLNAPVRTITLTSSVLAQISNTMAARLLAYTPRNAAENSSVNWSKVLQYAEKGISAPSNRFDMGVPQDGGTKWYSYIMYYGAEKSWLRIDMRLINMMDPSVPAKYAGTMVTPGDSPDARYASDFGYDGVVEGDVARGVYMQSPYWHKRYSFGARLSPTLLQGTHPFILAAENDLLIAEALIRTGGDLGRAASLINNSRVGRGHLPAASASEGAEKLLEYLFYERQVELTTTGAIEFYDMRRFDKLQPLAWRHLPIPARELETLNEPIYTFGGADNPSMRRSLPAGLALRLQQSLPKSALFERPIR